MNPSKQVLIVDDDPEMLLVVSALVEQAGFLPKTASTLESFKREFANQPSAVMLDLVMPGRVSERIVDFMAELHSTTPLFFMTSAVPEDIRLRQEHAHLRGITVQDVLVKPFWSKEVNHALEPLSASFAV
jgi:DNA-binding response OmpR family regulator